MSDLNKKADLNAEQIEQIRYDLARKANDWYLSGGHKSDGMEIYRTQEEGIFVLKDIETGVQLGMQKEVKNDGVLIHLSFFTMKDDAEDTTNADSAKGAD